MIEERDPTGRAANEPGAKLDAGKVRADLVLDGFGLALPSRITSTYLIHNADGQPYTGDGFSAMWQRMMAAWVEAGHERFTFHDLRAKAVTDTTEAGRKASDLTGHRTEAVVSAVYDRRRVRKAPAAR